MAQARAANPPLPLRVHRRFVAALSRAWRRQRQKPAKAWRRATWRARGIVIATLAIALWLPLNFAYQTIRQPAELLAPFGDMLMKTPAETWSDYAPLFRRYATASIAPELLAALAQVETAGNPLATTYWRWRFSVDPFAIYRPASSALGLFQMTDGAFAEAQNYCILRHRLARDDAGHDAKPCGEVEGAYFRIVPGNAVELAAIYLDRALGALLAQSRRRAITGRQADRLAAMIHLCGAGPAGAYVQRGFRLTPHERCGDQDVAAYLARVEAAEQQFRRLAQAK